MQPTPLEELSSVNEVYRRFARPLMPLNELVDHTHLIPLASVWREFIEIPWWTGVVQSAGNHDDTPDFQTGTDSIIKIVGTVDLSTASYNQDSGTLEIA